MDVENKVDICPHRPAASYTRRDSAYFRPSTGANFLDTDWEDTYGALIYVDADLVDTQARKLGDITLARRRVGEGIRRPRGATRPVVDSVDIKVVLARPGCIAGGRNVRHRASPLRQIGHRGQQQQGRGVAAVSPDKRDL